MDDAIEVKDLCVKLPGFQLKNVNLHIPKGVVAGVIGKNGAGKTTLIKTLADVYAIESGSIKYGGLTLPKDNCAVKHMLGVVYDSLFYPANLKASAIAKTIGTFYDDFDMDKWQKWMDKFHLKVNQAPGVYSKGMQMKFMLAMMLARNPQILLLDEPTAGLDPAARAELMEVIQEFMMDEEHTVVFSTHITSDLDKVADYIAMVADGQVVLADEKEALLDRYALVQVTKEQMTQEHRSFMMGVKENTFGYTGLTQHKDAFERTARPTIEDLLIYYENV